MKKRIIMAFVVVVAVAVLAVSGVVLASSSTKVEAPVSLKGKTIFLENSEIGFIISDEKIPALVEGLKEAGAGECLFVEQVETNKLVMDSATGVKFLTDDGEVYFQEGLDVYDIDHASVQWLIEGKIKRGSNPMIGMYNTQFGEIDYFGIAG
ncbi:hypothetical protein IKE98_00835 [Candidatus Saccharibacteria bacterium]|nr:hypothetical protein [Candidatus Saccharibacteria bacterium]